MSVRPGIGDIKFHPLVQVVIAIFSIAKASFSNVLESVTALRLAECWLSHFFTLFVYIR